MMPSLFHGSIVRSEMSLLTWLAHYICMQPNNPFIIWLIAQLKWKKKKASCTQLNQERVNLLKGIQMICIPSKLNEVDNLFNKPLDRNNHHVNLRALRDDCPNNISNLNDVTIFFSYIFQLALLRLKMKAE